MIVPGIDAHFQADLVDVQSLSLFNKGYKYLLTCIDILSKHAWVVPLKAKQGQELVKAFQTILSSGRKPDKLQTDQGTEFLNRVFQKFLRENNINFFTVNSGLKALRDSTTPLRTRCTSISRLKTLLLTSMCYQSW